MPGSGTKAIALMLSAAGFWSIVGSAGVAQAEEGRCDAPAVSAGGPSNRHTIHLENNLLPAIVQADTKPMRLADRMRAYNVPGVSVAVIHDGRLDWARGWGVRDVRTCAPVTPETAFQAASISKPVTAIVALRLVEQGKIGLDRDINLVLRSWQLPPDPKLAPAGVTLRQLLSHRAGLSVHGFPGYVPGAPLPSPAQILGGLPPANSEAVRSILPVEGQWRYSGGGYVLAQLALADAPGMPFDELAAREVLRPLGMTRSAFAQPPSSALLSDAALGHSDGRIVAGGYNVYPELGAAGLWTTAEDLARLLLDIQASNRGESGHRLSPEMTRTMLTAGKGDWGLGPALSGSGADRRFGHDGVNEGYQATMVAYAEKGEGIVVLTNGDGGKRLADEIVRAVAADYGWNALAPAPIEEVALSPETLRAVSGRYESDGLAVFIDAREDGLFAQTGGPAPERLAALSALRFRTDTSGILVEFTPAYRSFRIVEGGPPLMFIRAAAPASVSPSESDPIFLRGTMNGWSAGTPLRRQPDGSLETRVRLPAGEHQFKLGSEDWRIDYGTSAGEAAHADGLWLPLVPHGGNVRFLAEGEGDYRFALRIKPDGRGELKITREATGR